MASRGRRFTGRRGGPGPNYSWARLVDDENPITGKTFLASLTTGVDLDLTIRRNIIDGLIKSDQQAASENYGGAFGVIVVSTRAATVGVTAIPGPVTDQDANWMLWGSFFGTFFFATAVGFDTNAGSLFHFDSKAMRTMSEDETLAIMVEPSASSAGFTLTYGMSALVSLRGRG